MRFPVPDPSIRTVHLDIIVPELVTEPEQIPRTINRVQNSKRVPGRPRFEESVIDVGLAYWIIYRAFNHEWSAGLYVLAHIVSSKDYAPLPSVYYVSCEVGIGAPKVEAVPGGIPATHDDQFSNLGLDQLATRKVGVGICR